MESAASHPQSSILASRRILVRGVNWLGDAVMTTPALMRLRARFPDAHITLLTPDKLQQLWEHHPAVDTTIPFTKDEGLFAISRKLRAGRFDLALVLPNSPRSAMEVFFAGIPQRTGLARPWRNFFLTEAVAPRAEAVKMRKRSVEEINRLVAAEASSLRPSPFALRPSPFALRPSPSVLLPSPAHQMHEYLHLAAALGASLQPGAPQLFVTPEEMEAAKKKFGLDKITQPVFGLNPGAEYGPAKRWPIRNFVPAAQGIQQRTGCAWILFGGKADIAAANQIQTALPQATVFNLAGATSLRELMALLKICRVLLTNDTGPMHVAAALGTPVVVPFGSTSPELTGPGLPGDPRHRLIKSDAPCSPCFLRECPIDFRCMNGISVERVVEAVLAAQSR